MSENGLKGNPVKAKENFSLFLPKLLHVSEDLEYGAKGINILLRHFISNQLYGNEQHLYCLKCLILCATAERS